MDALATCQTRKDRPRGVQAGGVHRLEQVHQACPALRRRLSLLPSVCGAVRCGPHHNNNIQMKITSFTVHQATKFNDPHESYRNHSVGCDLHVELEEGETLDTAMEQARSIAREKVDREREALLARCNAQHEFEELKRDLRYKVDELDRYERDTRQYNLKRERLDEAICKMKSLAERLNSQGVFVVLPTLALPAAATIEASTKEDEEG